MIIGARNCPPTEQIGDAILCHDDCLRVLPFMAKDSVDMVLMDLPYGCMSDMAWDIPLDPERLWSEILRVAKSSAAIVLFAQGIFTAQLMMQQPQIFRYKMVWDKVLPGRHIHAKKMPMSQYEDILVFYRKLPVYHPQKVERINGSAKRDVNPTDILSFQKPTGRQYHPTEKPVELLEWLIKTYTNPGEVVLDATMGCGSTIVAALKAGRRGIGIELDEAFYRTAAQRIRSVVNS